MDTSTRLPVTLAATALVISLVGVALALWGVFRESGSAPPEHSARPASEVFQQYDDRGYSMASRYGDLVWTAGHLPETSSPGADVALQTRDVMAGLEATLEEAGASFDTVVMTNVYLTDFDDWDAFNAVYEEHFSDRLPPRVTVQISQLGFGDIEISMVAHVARQ